MKNALEVSSTRAVMYAGIIELLILALAAMEDTGPIKFVARRAMIAAAVGVVIGCTSIFAISPTIEKTVLAEHDQRRMTAMDENVKSLREALEAVKGQKSNSAVASRSLQKAITERQQLLAGLKPDKTLTAVKENTKWLLIALRIIMQLSNLLLITELKKIWTAEPGEQAGRESDNQPAPVQAVSIDDVLKMIPELAANKAPLMDFGRPTKKEDPETYKKQRADSVEYSEEEEGEREKPKDKVLRLHPDAICRKNGGRFEVRTKAGDVLGKAGSSPLAWVAASQNNGNGNGRRSLNA